MFTNGEEKNGQGQGIKLGKDVRLIIMQFSFKNRRAVPVTIRELDQETPIERNARTSRSVQGIKVINNVPNTQINLCDDLEYLDYELVDAYYKKRIDPKNTSEQYQMIRFTFAKRNGKRKFNKHDGLREELKEICETSIWRVRAFINPYFRNGEEVEGQKAISINMEVRTPLFDWKGSPRKNWKKDDDGNLTFETEIKASSHLIVKDGEIKLI